MKSSTILFIAIAVVAIGAIPLYGVITGHYAEMMGGRMMVWGIAWVLLILIVTVGGITLLLLRIRRSWKRRV